LRAFLRPARLPRESSSTSRTTPRLPQRTVLALGRARGDSAVVWAG